MSNPTYKRRKKLINKRLQLKMIGVFTAIGGVCALFQIVLVNFSLLEVAKNAPAGGDQILHEARSMMFTNVAWTLGALVPLMVCVGLVVTHRVAGPAYRMTQHCKAIAEGAPVTTCKIREGDELGDLCDALNAAMARISGGVSGEAAAGTADDMTPAATDAAAGAEWDLDNAPSLVKEVTSEDMGVKLDAPAAVEAESEAS